MSNLVVPQSEWEWFGCPGHYICSSWCRFHLCTKVGPYVVSTVGEYIHPRHCGGSEQIEREWIKENWPGEDIGCDRKYETMVFLAGERCEDPECDCGCPKWGSGGELGFAGYNQRGDAQKGHLALCLEFAAKPKGENADDSVSETQEEVG